MHPIHAYNFKINVMCLVRVRSKVKIKHFHIWPLRSGRLVLKSSNSPNVLVNTYEEYCMSTKAIPKKVKANVRSQKVTIK